MDNFTPWSALLGGALIGASASLLLMFNGKVAGVSGIVAGLFERRATNADGAPRERWRAWFVAGLWAGGLSLSVLQPEALAVSPRPLAILLGAGLLVGVGTRMGGGCTSGHGVCGVSRGSLRSIVASVVFVATGVLSASVLHYLSGAAP